MRLFTKILLPAVVAACFGLAGCNSTSTIADQNPGGDPANGNLAPADQSAQTSSNQTQGQPANYAAAPAAPEPAQYAAAPTSGSSDSGDDVSQGPAIEANEPPPPLPDYSQPPCPGNDYIWNPGYWDYASAGYYWVPGVWVLAPYTDALWTPPWWGFTGGRYMFHAGYWGPHIGFYGGVNYGFGYTGTGFYGGYWNNGNFAYNREVTNVNTSVVRNVYNYHVTNVTTNRVSYNGGAAGLRVRPTAQERAVVNDQRMGAVAAQVAHARESQTNREQLASVNRGRPAALATSNPLQTTYRAPAARPAAVPEHPPIIQARPRTPETRAQNQAQPERPQQPAAPNRGDVRPPAEAARPQTQPQRSPERAQPQPAPQGRPEPAQSIRPQQQAERPVPPQRSAAPAVRPEQRPVPAARPPQAPAPEPRPAPAPARPEARPATAPRPIPQARPAAPPPQPRPEARPAPAPAARPAPAPQNDGKREEKK